MFIYNAKREGRWKNDIKWEVGLICKSNNGGGESRGAVDIVVLVLFSDTEDSCWDSNPSSRVQTKPYAQQFTLFFLLLEMAKRTCIFFLFFTKQHTNSTFECQDKLWEQNIAVGQRSESDTIIFASSCFAI